MIYADTDFFVALVKDSDWLGKNAQKILEEYRGEIRTSLPTFIELFFLAEDYDWDRGQAAAHILEIAETDFDESIVFQASEYIDEGMTVIDSFQAALAEEKIISSDKKMDETDLERIKLEEEV